MHCMNNKETLSAANKKIKQLQGYNRSSKKRREAGVFVAEGIRLCREVPDKYLTEVYLTPDLEGEADALKAPYFLVDGAVFSKISDTQTPQGILALCSRPEYRFDDILGDGKHTPLVVVLEDIQDPGNLGTIMRVSEAAGVTGVIMSRGCADIFSPKAVRATMGSIFRVPFIVTEDIEASISDLKAKGVTVYAAHLKGSEDYAKLDFKKPSAFLIGNEGNGLKDETAALADKRLFIPMEGQIESLNAGVATAVLVYEAHRQRA